MVNKVIVPLPGASVPTSINPLLPPQLSMTSQLPPGVLTMPTGNVAPVSVVPVASISTLPVPSCVAALSGTGLTTSGPIVPGTISLTDKPLMRLTQSSPIDLGGGGDDGNSRTNLIINYLPQTTSQEEIKRLFGEYGEIESCKLVRDKITGQSLGFGFVNYKRPDDAEKAIENLNQLRIQNKTIKVSLARPSSESIKGANLYVSGLPKTLSQLELETLFGKAGEIISSRILVDPTTGTSKGVGFVRYDKRCEAERAIEILNGFVPERASEKITVKFANNPSSKAAAAIPFPLAASCMAPTARHYIGPIHNTTGRFSSLYRFSPFETPGLIPAAAMPSMVSSMGAFTLPTTSLSMGAAMASLPPTMTPAGLPTPQVPSMPNFSAGTAAGMPGMLGAGVATSGLGSMPTVGNPLGSAAGILGGLGAGHAALGGPGAALNSASLVAASTAAAAAATSPGYCLFVYNLPAEATDASLWEVFGPYGAVLSVKVVRDYETHKCKGFGFVTMANYQDAYMAVSRLDGSQMGDRLLQVSFKHPRKM